MSAADGPNITRKALVSSALAAATSAATASSGVAKVLPMSAALAATTAPRANTNATLSVDWESRFKEFMNRFFEIFISIRE